MDTPHDIPLLFWLLGTDDTGQWHQRIIQAESLDQADAWWLATLDRKAEVAISQETLEGGVGALVAIEDALVRAEAGRLFGAWVAKRDHLDLVPVAAIDAQEAQDKIEHLNPDDEVKAIVDAKPLIATLARMRAIAQGELMADEILTD